MLLTITTEISSSRDYNFCRDLFYYCDVFDVAKLNISIQKNLKHYNMELIKNTAIQININIPLEYYKLGTSKIWVQDLILKMFTQCRIVSNEYNIL